MSWYERNKSYHALSFGGGCRRVWRGREANIEEEGQKRRTKRKVTGLLQDVRERSSAQQQAKKKGKKKRFGFWGQKKKKTTHPFGATPHPKFCRPKNQKNKKKNPVPTKTKKNQGGPNVWSVATPKNKKGTASWGGEPTKRPP